MREFIDVTLEQAQSIIRRARSDQTGVVNLHLDDRKSHLSGGRWYQIDVSDAQPAYLLLAPSSLGTDNALSVVSKITSTIAEHTSIPIPLHTLDSTLETVPFEYILFPLPHSLTQSNSRVVSLADAKDRLSDTDLMRLDLQLGVYLAQLHSIQNDWFGAPVLTNSPTDPSYSWQETFTQLLESTLSAAETSDQLELPYEDIRRYLSRAISSFLFDDIEVPSLVWFAGTAHDVLIQTGDDGEHSIVMILPTMSHAIWADPLLETFFMPVTGSYPQPSPALLEGYKDAGGGTLVLFPRQKTKRLWYNLYLALSVILRQDPVSDAKGGGPNKWAMEVLQNTVSALKDSPCY